MCLFCISTKNRHFVFREDIGTLAHAFDVSGISCVCVYDDKNIGPSITTKFSQPLYLLRINTDTRRKRRHRSNFPLILLRTQTHTSKTSLLMYTEKSSERAFHSLWHNVGILCKRIIYCKCVQDFYIFWPFLVTHKYMHNAHTHTTRKKQMNGLSY